MPITSNGIIAYRKHPETKAIEYLMIRRKDTLGLMDFIRGKYSVNNKYYIMNMISQMTVQERAMLLEHTFDEIWEKIWDKPIAPPGLSVNKSPSYEYGESRYKTEEMVSREKFNQLKNGVYLNPLRRYERILDSNVADAQVSANPLRRYERILDSNVADAQVSANPLRRYERILDSKSAGTDSQSSWSMTDKDMNPAPVQNVNGLHLWTCKTTTSPVREIEPSGKEVADLTFSQRDSNGVPPNMFVQTSPPTFTLATMINECPTKWDEPEWGFPKGKRNYNESDIDCALREFYEETGIKSRNMTFVINNLAPHEEIFMGSNYKSYKHRYFLMYVDYNTSVAEKMTDMDKFEISKVEWKSFNECLGAIRPYNLEKKRILSNINIVLTSCTTTLA